MNTNFEALKRLAETALREEYKDYYGGYQFILRHTECNISVKYVDVQSKVEEVIENNREIANKLNEYFDSDVSLANCLIEYIKEEVAA